MSAFILGGLLLFFVVAAILSRYFAPSLYKWTKPLPVLSLILLYFTMVFFVSHLSGGYHLIGLGLIFGLAGDILLLKPERFLHGLGAFLVGHWMYVIAFCWRPVSLSIPGILFLLPLAVWAVIFFRQQLAEKGKMHYFIPVMIYVISLSIMVLTSLNAQRYAPGFPFIVIGAVLFAISDFSLAYNKFASEFKWAGLVILATYYTGQGFIFWGSTIHEIPAH